MEVSFLDKIKQLSRHYFIIGAVVLLLVLIYISGAIYFNSHFLPNTFAGPVKISQLNPTSALETFEEELGASTLIFKEDESEIGYIELSQLELQSNVQNVLNQSIKEQNQWAWPFTFFSGKNVINIKEQVQLDDGMVAGLIPTLGVNNEERNPTMDARLEKNEDGTIDIVTEQYGNQLSSDSLETALVDAIGKGESSLDLKSAYIQPSETTESETIKERQSQLEAMKSTLITLEFDGNSVTIPQEQIASWIYLDEANQPKVDTEAAENFILSLNEEYSGLLNPRWFYSTYQGEVQVNPGTYGWYIDRFEEGEQIVEDIYNGAQVTREPVIYGSGYGMGDNVGSDYVEVDIANQMMFIYRGDELVLETPIVSGIVGAETVPGAYQVWNMERDTNLVGYNTITEKEYTQPVSYWIAFDDQAQGIHDASWQSNFGGNAYVTAGSLGCINTPPGTMGQVFELVEYGMPVIVF